MYEKVLFRACENTNATQAQTFKIQKAGAEVGLEIHYYKFFAFLLT